MCRNCLVEAVGLSPDYTRTHTGRYHVMLLPKKCVKVPRHIKHVHANASRTHNCGCYLLVFMQFVSGCAQSVLMFLWWYWLCVGMHVAMRMKEGSAVGLGQSGEVGVGWAEALQWSTEKSHSFIRQLTPSG